ncbi:MAG: electron transfer flavoprotein subunit alpha/FixB family protein [Pseudomonadota bacterium]
MAGDILVLVETKSGKIKKSSFELLSQASRLGSSLGAGVKALLIGEGVRNAALEAGPYGASEVYVADHPEFRLYNAERYAAVAVETCRLGQVSALLATASSIGRDLMPRVAARLNTGMITECTALEARNGKLVGRRPIYAGKATVEVEIPETRPQVITCRPNVFETAKPDPSKKPRTTDVGKEAAALAPKAGIVEIIQAKNDRPDLTEASVIVSGGRALKSGDNFKVLYELADTLGAAVGASRAAVDAGYVPHSIQVGQTGKTVNPTLYIAAGISGAIQHLAGMRTSKVVVAINSDPEAPIFQECTYGIVGDLFEVLPALTEEFKKLLKE